MLSRLCSYRDFEMRVRLRFLTIIFALLVVLLVWNCYSKVNGWNHAVSESYKNYFARFGKKKAVVEETAGGYRQANTAFRKENSGFFRKEPTKSGKGLESQHTRLAVRDAATTPDLSRLISNRLSQSNANNLLEAWITQNDVHNSIVTNTSYSRERLLSLGEEYVNSNDDFTWKPSQIRFLNNTEGPCWKTSSNSRGVLCLPKVYLAGFSKCGTTDLWYFLKWHRRLYRGDGRGKEPFWWNMFRISWPETARAPRLVEDYGASSKLSMDVYLDLISHDPRVGIIDASTGTLTDNVMMTRTDLSTWSREPSLQLRQAIKDFQITAVHLIYQYTPQAKFILILRDPVQRLYSDYVFAFWKHNSLHNQKPSQADFHNRAIGAIKNFRQCLVNGFSLRYCCYDPAKVDVGLTPPMATLQKGLYVVYINDLLKIVKREDLLVLHTDDYAKDKTKVIEEAFNFLNIGKDTKVREEITKRGKARKNSRKEHGSDIEEMWPETKRLLKDFYKPFNEELAILLGDKKWLFE